MARPARLDIAGGWYHVLNRGIEGKSIFRGRSDYEQFLGLMGTLRRRFGLRLHAYVLMPNHYHLQVETSQANLSRAIQWLNVSYSIWFNKTHQRAGPLFRGRFKAILHNCSSHALIINKYIHLNPVRVRHSGSRKDRTDASVHASMGAHAAARVDALRAYPWSSYRYYSGKERAPLWLSTQTVLELLEPNRKAAGQAAAYRRVLEHAAATDQWETDWKTEIKASLLLGPGDFVQRMKKRLSGDRREPTGLRKANQGILRWERITAAVSQVWGQDWESLRTSYGASALAAALYLARNHSDQTLRQLGVLAGRMQYPAVTMAIHRFGQRLKADKTLARKVKRLERMLQIKT
jgi:putative transposase